MTTESVNLGNTQDGPFGDATGSLHGENSHAQPAPLRLDPPGMGRNLKKLLLWFIPAIVGIYTLWGAMPGILLPLQVEGIDPANKVANLAIVTTIGAAAAMIAQPIAGVISDRTRSRFGRRTVPKFLLRCYRCLDDDRSDWWGYARGKFRKNLSAGFLVFAGISILTTVLFVVFNPDASSKNLDVRKFDLGTFLKVFWVNPKHHPDFMWAVLGRLLLYAGYFAIMGYNLYLLQDLGHSRR